MHSVETILALVMIATVVATFARRWSVPAPSLLVVAGVVAGLIPGVPAVRVSPDIVSLVVLPPLIYAAGEELAWRDLRHVWRPVSVLAVGLVLASAAAVAAVAAAISPLSTLTAFVLGAVLASTDPVAVTALGRRLSLPPRVQALVQAESLFNDATSLVLFRVAVSVVVAGGSVAWGHAAGQFAVLAGGGALAGAAVAAAVSLVRSRTDDPVLETVIALVTPYLAYIVGEAAHGSGVTAVVVASVLLGNLTHRLTTPDIRLQLDAVYGTVVFLLESVVFALIGLQLPILIRALSAGHNAGESRWPLEALAIAGTLLAVRVVWVFPLSAVTQFRRGDRRPSWQVPAVVSWAGARGVIPLAAALSIPLMGSGGHPFPNRDLVQVLATMVIVVTLVIQGFTLAPLVRRAGVAIAPTDAVEEDSVARLRLARSALDHLDQLAELEAAPAVVIDQLRRNLEARIAETRPVPGDRPPADSTAATYRRIRQDLIDVESRALAALYNEGSISEATRRRLQRLLDLEASGLG